MAADQPNDLDILSLKFAGTGLKLKEALIQEVSPALLCDISNGWPCPIVPVAWRSQVFGLYSLPLAPWDLCVSEAGRSQVHLAWPLQGCKGLGSCLHGLSAD